MNENNKNISALLRWFSKDSKGTLNALSYFQSGYVEFFPDGKNINKIMR